MSDSSNPSSESDASDPLVREQLERLGVDRTEVSRVLATKSAGWQRVLMLSTWACLLISISLIVLTPMHRYVKLYLGHYYYSANSFITLDDTVWIDKGPYTKRELIVLDGDADASTESERWLALHQLAPTHPAYYIPYVTFYFKEHECFPEGHEDFVSSYDPHNSFYAFLSLQNQVDNLVSREKLKEPDEKGRSTVYTLKDVERAREVLDFIIPAIKNGVYSSYQQELCDVKSEILGEITTYPEIFSDFFRKFLRDIYLPSNRTVSHLLLHEVQASAAAGDWVQVGELISVIQKLANEINLQAYSSLNILISVNIIRALSEEARFLLALDLPADLRASLEAFVHEYDSAQEWSDANDTTELDELISRYGNSIYVIGYGTKYANSAPGITLTKEELLPGNKSEKSFLAQLYLWYHYYPILLVILLFALFSYCFPRASRLAVRHYHAHYTKASQVLVMLGVCVVMPLVVFFLFGEVLHCGRAEESFTYCVSYDYFCPLFSQLLALMTAWLWLPLLWGQRVMRSGKLTPYQWGALWCALIGGLLSYLPIPVGALLWLSPAFSACACLLFWGNGFLVLRSSVKLKSVLKARLTLPCYALSALCLITVIVYFGQVERYWCSQDHASFSKMIGSNVLEDRYIMACKKKNSTILDAL